MPTIHGASLSPFVRKVRVCLLLKSIDYDLTMVFPGSEDPEFRKISPLGKIPAFTDGAYSLCDSSAICAYLEKKQPTPAIFPDDAAALGKALWYEEYADTKMLEDATVQIFFPRVVTAKLMRQEIDTVAVQQVVDQNVPPIFDYLEDQLSTRSQDKPYFVGDRLTIADISVASQLINLNHAGVEFDQARWPHLVRFFEFHTAEDYFSGFLTEERAFIETNGA